MHLTIICLCGIRNKLTLVPLNIKYCCHFEQPFVHPPALQPKTTRSVCFVAPAATSYLYMYICAYLYVCVCFANVVVCQFCFIHGTTILLRSFCNDIRSALLLFLLLLLCLSSLLSLSLNFLCQNFLLN